MEDDEIPAGRLDAELERAVARIATSLTKGILEGDIDWRRIANLIVGEILREAGGGFGALSQRGGCDCCRGAGGVGDGFDFGVGGPARSAGQAAAELFRIILSGQRNL